MRVAHVITNLNPGGAQVMLRRLLPRLEACGVHSTVVSLASEGPLVLALASDGIPVRFVDVPSGVPSLAALLRLKRTLVEQRPDVVQTWLYQADLLGGLAARAARLAPVVWGLHHVPYPGEPLKRKTHLVVRANARLSSWLPARIICCAHTARTAHAALGYPADRMVVIPNGFDTEAYRPDQTSRRAVRDALGLDAAAELVTMVARFHPHKDHRTFLRAAGRLAARRPSARFALVGDGVEPSNASLEAWIGEAGLGDRVHVLGHRDDVAQLMAASDLVSLASSATEAMPLVLGEAMACGVPCVATDVGDCAALIGETGRVVPPGDPEALAAAWVSILGLPASDRAALGQRARDRVRVHYGLDACAASYAAVYDGVRPSGRTGAA